MHEASVTQRRGNGANRQLKAIGDPVRPVRCPSEGGYRGRVPPPSAAADAAPAAQRSWRRLAAALVLVEGVLALGGAAVYLAELLTANATVARNVVMLVLILAGLGIGLLFVSRGLLAGRRWARSPAVTWQILLIAVAWYVVSAGRVFAGVVVAAVAVLTALAAVRGTPVDA